MKHKSIVVILFLFCLFSTDLKAGFFKKVRSKAKGVVKKVEHTLGWDRYIYCWGNRLVPPENRWVAIRSAIPRKKRDIGRFWDVPGDGKQVMGAHKEIKLWDITFQEYPKVDRRYRFVSVYNSTHHPDDFDYYWIQSKTGMWVEAYGKGKGIQLNKGYNIKDRTSKAGFRYQWKVQNVGKNRFVFINRGNNKAIDARGGVAKKGTIVQQWDNHGRKSVQWEFIYIAQGKEIKSTKQMAKNRANAVRKQAKKITNTFAAMAKKVSQTISKQAKKSFNSLTKKKLISLEKKSNNVYTFKIGFPNQKNLLDELKAKTIDKFFKLDLKKIVLEPVGKNKIAIGIKNKIECLGHHVDLTFEFLGNWSLDKDGFKISNFKMNKFLLPLLPHSLTKEIRNAISKESQKLSIRIKNFPGSNKLSVVANKKRKFKVINSKKGPYGFETTLSL